MATAETATTPTAPRDRLDEIFHRVRLRGDFYCQAELTEPWNLEMPAMPDTISFHVVTEGNCRLELEGREPLALRSGDLALVPHGRGHNLVGGQDTSLAFRVDL
ncbi:MAG: cupin domain-containing protein, partial [Propionibacteriaceae bacterium]|nr:cupin domain-containing protein [Propionibacteriaceae bacterium]